MTRKFVLINQKIRQRAADYVLYEAPENYEILGREQVKKREQEEKYHAMLGEIFRSKLFIFLDRADWSEEDIKRLLVDAFATEMINLGTPLCQSGRVVPSLDSLRTVQLGIQTRGFRIKEAAAFIEYLYAYGSELGVRFSQ